MDAVREYLRLSNPFGTIVVMNLPQRYMAPYKVLHEDTAFVVRNRSRKAQVLQCIIEQLKLSEPNGFHYKHVQ